MYADAKTSFFLTAVGDTVAEDEVVCEIETDKVKLCKCCTNSLCFMIAGSCLALPMKEKALKVCCTTLILTFPIYILYMPLHAHFCCFQLIIFEGKMFS